MARRVAVLTDSLSDEFFFPLWVKYYGDMFGKESLHVIAYAGGCSFFGQPLGGILRLPVPYDDKTRADVISDYVCTLLGVYDVVIRVDVDEFLVVDPRLYDSLKAFVDAVDKPYYTARGFDVLHEIDKPALSPGLVLSQRDVAYPNSALNKTCITSIPLHWSEGFHWCNAYPFSGPLFLLHFKRIDIDWQVRWFSTISANIKDNPRVEQIFKDYYDPNRSKIVEYHKNISARHRETGIESFYRIDHETRFFSSIAFNADTDLYTGSFSHDMVLCEIPIEWRQLI